MTHPCSVHCVLNKALHDTFTPLDNMKSAFKREKTAQGEQPFQRALLICSGMVKGPTQALTW